MLSLQFFKKVYKQVLPKHEELINKAVLMVEYVYIE